MDGVEQRYSAEVVNLPCVLHYALVVGISLYKITGFKYLFWREELICTRLVTN